ESVERLAIGHVAPDVEQSQADRQVDPTGDRLDRDGRAVTAGERQLAPPAAAAPGRLGPAGAGGWGAGGGGGGGGGEEGGGAGGEERRGRLIDLDVGAARVGDQDSVTGAREQGAVASDQLVGRRTHAGISRPIRRRGGRVRLGQVGDSFQGEMLVSAAAGRAG